MKTMESKRSEAEVRNTKWKALSFQEQMLDLDQRLGQGVGAKRQRTRILKAADQGIIMAGFIKE